MLDFDPSFPYHICDFAWKLMEKGAFKIDKSMNDDVLVTYHDPCNVARAAGFFEPPRKMTRYMANHFYEMHPDTIRERTYCCGGGGGVLADELTDLRTLGGRARAEAIKNLGKKLAREHNGDVRKWTPNYLCTPCAICKASLPDSMSRWNVLSDWRGEEESEVCVVGGVHDLMLKSIIF
ncbi:MAG: (Fe-S)-binding protein [candidate division Zixibacteria bacterium]|nr:(Fe-S)-binding protein [Candidatus Tariuqbacter arcticus]